MKKVTHITPYMDPSAGGPPVVVERLFEQAASLGWSAQVVTTGSHSDDSGLRLSTRSGFTVIGDGSPILRPQDRQKLKQTVAGSDIVHCHTLWSPLVSKAGTYARQAGIPYIVSPHGMLDPYSLSQKAIKKRLYMMLFERRFLRQADCVLFTTDEEKRLAEQMVGPFNATAIVSLGADVSEDAIDSLQSALFEKHPTLARKKIILFCGRIHEKKRPEALVDAMPRILESVPDAALVFVGSGDESLMRRLKDKVQAHSLEQSILFLGFLTGRDKWAAFAASKLFALPSHQENFGIAVAEALRMGVPALLTRRVNIWSEIIENDAGLVAEEDDIVTGIAEKSIAVLSNDDYQAELSLNARTFSDKNYTWTASAEATHALYERMLDRARSGVE